MKRLDAAGERASDTAEARVPAGQAGKGDGYGAGAGGGAVGGLGGGVRMDPAQWQVLRFRTQ